MSEDDEFVEDVRAHAEELRRVLDDYSNRLRRMRRRNRQLELEIGEFEEELVRLRESLERRL
jgi:predicted  nucleic acid-binding Zn-ribbon protein